MSLGQLLPYRGRQVTGLPLPISLTQTSAANMVICMPSMVDSQPHTLASGGGAGGGEGGAEALHDRIGGAVAERVHRALIRDEPIHSRDAVDNVKLCLVR